jgi:hypothetical protein
MSGHGWAAMENRVSSLPAATDGLKSLSEGGFALFMIEAIGGGRALAIFQSV